MEGTEVAVVDAAEVGTEGGILQFLFAVHFEQHFEAEGVGFLQQRGTLLHAQAGGDEQYGRGSAEVGGVELCLVDDEVLIEDGQGDTALAGRADELVGAAEVMLVGEDAQGGSAVLLIAQRNLVGAAFFLDPALRGRAPLELGDDARLALEQGGAQGGASGGSNGGRSIGRKPSGGGIPNGKTAGHTNGGTDGSELLALRGDDLLQDILHRFVIALCRYCVISLSRYYEISCSARRTS